MKCVQHVAHNTKFEKMGLFRHPRWWQKTLKGPPTCFNVVTTFDKPSTLTHKAHISFRSYFLIKIYESWEHVHGNHSMGLFRQLNFGWGKAQFSVCETRLMTKFSRRNSELFETREVALKTHKSFLFCWHRFYQSCLFSPTYQTTWHLTHWPLGNLNEILDM